MDEIRQVTREQAWLKIGAELRRLRTERQLSLSAFARQVHYSKGYLSKLETGDKRITLDLASRCDEVLETGGVLAALIPDQWPGEPAQELEPASDECPYRGLAPFGSEDACWFFGREAVTADLIDQLGERLDGDGAPLVVVAPSGTGKSSLLQAGLIPALNRGALPGSGS